ncbi:MAG: CDP-diacylglycerol--serine O-phosphatidyltransferase [Deltaproteobacteria bacterium]|jgi:CDP-diacylglycerol--serine O-phosphatidyltransferase|nr:CDP-diacylglycerol--serine O-phosphatidyltransferase [Deltaproteobacteria bacterium]
MSQKRKRGESRRAIYIFPNLFTTMSLFCGFYSIISSVRGNYTLASYLILVAAIMDALDGTVARMTNTTSRFGVEYDSLCDLLSFGAAPSVLVYLWALDNVRMSALPSPDYKTIGLGVIVAFIFLACGAMRLARFNVSAGRRDPGFFQGMPIPGGAGILAALCLWHHRLPRGPIEPNGPMILIFVLVLSYLMVSNLDFFSLKNKALTKNNHPFETLVGMITLLAFMIIKAKTVLFPIGMIYLVSGPIVTVVRRLRKKGQAPLGDGKDDSRDDSRDDARDDSRDDSRDETRDAEQGGEAEDADS